MSRTTKLIATLFFGMSSLVLAGARDIDNSMVKKVPGVHNLEPKEGTSDLFFPENVIQADVLTPDVPDIDYEKQALAFDLGNLKGFFKLKWKPESFYGKNVNLLNNNVDADRVYFSRSTIDANLALEYGKCCYGHEALEFYMTLRHKVVWGNPGTSASTAASDVKLLDSILGPHSHKINRQFPWIREIWLRFNINDSFGLSFCNQHYFTAGSFPFELGRGIALGTAYAVNPGVLGFYSENTVDQYAYGFNFSGKLVDDILSYDLYGAILENLMDNFRATTAKVRAQEIGRRLNPQRGTGKVDYVIAGRLQWVPVDNDEMKISCEPYFLYNKAPEQKVEFAADAKGRLGTLGFAGEFGFGNFEWGFDTAFNLGSQKVRGWDRNRVKFENREGALFEVNDRVVLDPTDPKSAKALFIPRSSNQNAVEDVNISQGQNGELIQGTDNPQLFNDTNRFRDGYHNDFEGWMFVIDAAYNFCCDQLTLAAEVGIASGDEDPNKDLNNPNDSDVDGDFKGFIGLQEIYSGNRVKSVFLLGGAGRAPRPLSSPSQDTVLDTTPSTVSNFTNLVYVGTSLEWKPRCWSRYFMVKPNILGYWQQHRTKKFDLTTNKSSVNEFARAYLGTEVNCFANVQLLKDFTMFWVGSVFIPGAHYKDIKGKPLNAAQQKILDRADKLGLDKDLLPLVGNDVAWTFNIGLEARF